MMKKIFTYAAAAAALMIAASCSEETSYNKGVYEGGDAIALKLHMDNGIETKSDYSDGVGLENAVNSVQYFFYTDTTKAPVYASERIVKPTMTNDNAYIISGIAGQDFPSLNVLFPTNGSKVVVFGVFNYPETLEGDALQTIKAKTVEQHFAYNYTDPTYKERSGYVVIPDSMVGADPSNPVEKYFVMTGQKEIELKGIGNYAVNDVVEMRRLEAKFTFIVNIEDEIVNTTSTTEGEGESAVTTVVTETWTPILNEKNVRIYLCNADNTAVLGSPDASPKYSYKKPFNKPSRFNYAPVIIAPESATSYTINSPEFYSYPMTWAKGESTEPFVKLIIPWKMEQTTQVGDADPVITYSTERELYYKVMFPETVINSNNHYEFTITVSLLGSEFADPTVTIPSQAQVLPWNSNKKVNPVISDAKYLSLEKAEVNDDFSETVYEGNPKDFETIYTTGTTVGFAASDVVTLKLINVYQRNLSTGNTEYFVQEGNINNSAITTYNNRNASPMKGTETEYDAGVINGWFTVNNTNQVIELKHILNSDMTSRNFDVTPYTYEVEVHLGAVGSATYSDETYTKYIKIIQYPQVYVVENPNSNTPSGTTPGNYGKDGIYINGSNSNNTTWGGYNLGGANGITRNSGNKNPNMYVLTISVSDKYIIGDPRTASVSVPSFEGYDWWEEEYYSYYEEAPSTYNDSEKNILTNYHPASSSNTSNMIAPKIRVASSYGVCSVGNGGLNGEDSAILRCATYQEDGIPAGRWRLPTFAEVEFISTLSSLGRIPYLFGYNQESSYWGRNAYYYTANGTIVVENKSKTVKPYSNAPVNSTSVRCVYDEWFWGDATTRPVGKDTFTWGDENY